MDQYQYDPPHFPHTVETTMLARFLCSLLLPVQALLAQGIPESPEPNDSPGTATPFAPGLQAIGSLSFAGDKDWYLFVLPAPADLMATTGWTLGLAVDTDTILTLFASDGVTVIGSNDDRGLDRWS